MAPIHVREVKIPVSLQNFALCDGLGLWWCGGFTMASRMRIERIRATTPPSLEGTDRKMAYANKKYHSGWI